MAKNVMRMLGYSGTGKGTRTLAIIRYLMEDKKITPMVFKIKSKDESNGTFRGMYFKEYNLLIFGNVVKNHAGVYSWQGLDGIGPKPKTYGKVFDWYRDLIINNDYSIVCEGNMGWRNNILEKDYLYYIENLKLYLFNYATEEEYKSRIFERSGKIVKRPDDYNICASTERKINDFLKENTKTNVDAKILSHKEEMWITPARYMSTFSLEDGKAIEEKYKNNLDLVLRKCGEENSPSQKFLKTVYEWVKESDILKTADAENTIDVNKHLNNFIINFKNN